MDIVRMRRQRVRTTLAAAGMLTTGAIAAGFALPKPLDLPPVPVPAENPLTESKRVLGKILFWDVQLSSDNTVACGTCHMPAAGMAEPFPASHPGADGAWGTADDARGSAGIVRQTASDGFVNDLLFGFERQVTGRSAQAVGMSMFADDLFWDGRASTTFRDPISGEVVIASGGGLESHVLAPPASDVEMAHEDRDWASIAARLAGLRPLAVATDLPPDVAAVIGPETRYPELFAAAFGDPEVTPVRIAFAIASYERTLVPDQTPFDTGTMTREQEQGWVFFNDPRTRCAECHTPPQFTNHEFRTIGLRPPSEDPGRMTVTGDPADAGAFKVPTLRNVGLKRSFMRDGRLDSLAEVLRFYHAPSGLQFSENIDPELPRIRVPGGWRPFIIDFLEGGLTDPRAAAGAFPFDRPTLHDELPANPRVIGGGRPGTDGRRPSLIAHAPPNLGNDGFAVGLIGGPPNATARVVLSERPPNDRGVLEPDPSAEPIAATPTLTLSDLGHATWSWPIPDDPSLVGRRMFVQWVIDAPAAGGGLVHSPVLQMRFFRDDPRQGLEPEEADATRGDRVREAAASGGDLTRGAGRGAGRGPGAGRGRGAGRGPAAGRGPGSGNGRGPG
ncbi:MAG: cytochrome-c peroxidase [Planctomycetota bacterium]|jgi:cytochrome c peroxidase